MQIIRKPLAIEFSILQVNKVGRWTKNNIACPELINDNFIIYKFKNGVSALISNYPLPEDFNDDIFTNNKPGTIMQQSIFKDRFCVIIDTTL